MSEGFLHRWSRRKIEGDAAPAEAAEAPRGLPNVSPVAAPAAAATVAQEPAAVQQEEQPPLPTLADTESLTPESDFKPFVARNVAPEVRNAAMKKLFADPHFNVMDRLDTYIDDYSNPAPLPAASLRKMASAVFLKLVDEEEEEGAEAARQNKVVQETPCLTSLPDVAKSEPSGEDPSPPDELPKEGDQLASQDTDDDHADLRLQQDDAAGAEDPRRGTA
jgi:hypothetical protein